MGPQDRGSLWSTLGAVIGAFAALATVATLAYDQGKDVGQERISRLEDDVASLTAENDRLANQVSAAADEEVLDVSGSGEAPDAASSATPTPAGSGEAPSPAPDGTVRLVEREGIDLRSGERTELASTGGAPPGVDLWLYSQILHNQESAFYQTVGDLDRSTCEDAVNGRSTRGISMWNTGTGQKFCFLTDDQDLVGFEVVRLQPNASPRSMTLRVEQF